MTVQVEIQTDDDEGCQVDSGLMSVLPRVGDTMYGPQNAPGPWLVTDLFWTKPMHTDGLVQKVAVMVRLNDKYASADEGDIRSDYGA